MQNICPICGLPQPCACKVIEREAEKIRIRIEKRKFGKTMTIIEGIREGIKDIASTLKSKLACGGTIKNGNIELQGNHKNKVKEILVKLGYSEDQIEII